MCGYMCGYMSLSCDDGLEICRPSGRWGLAGGKMISEGWALRFIGYPVFLSCPVHVSHCPEIWGGELATYSHHSGAVYHYAASTMMDGISSNCVTKQILPPLSWFCKVFYSKKKSKHYSCISSNGWVAIQSVHPFLCLHRHCVGVSVPLLSCQHWFLANTDACVLSFCGLTCVCSVGGEITHLGMYLPASCISSFLLLW